MKVFEARNKKELLYSLLICLSGRDSNFRIVNLSGFNIPSLKFDVGLVDVKYDTTIDKIKYHVLGECYARDADELFIFHDFSPLLRGAKSSKVTLIEHGLVNYFESQDIFNQMSKLSRFFYCILSATVSGRNDKIESVLVQHPEALPGDIFNKGKFLDIFKLWNEIDEEDQYELNRIFGYSSPSCKCSLIITQNLELFDGFSDLDKIDLYSDIISNQVHSGEILVKKHPLENTIYSEYFPDVIEVDGSYPLELLLLNDLDKIEQVITLFSSAALSFIGYLPVVWLGTNGHSKLNYIEHTVRLPIAIQRKINEYR